MYRPIQARPFLAVAGWRILVMMAAAALATSATADDSQALPRTPSPEGASAYIIAPADGSTVSSPVSVRFGLVGMGVAPAGVHNSKTGHHHLIIDAPTPRAGAPIPKDANHRHFGGGQTEVSVELEPGSHTLQLVLGDHIHVPHDPPVASETITITVE